MDFVLKLFLSLLLGAAVGLERESGEGERENALLSAGGVRTYSLVCFLGAISGVMFVRGFSVPFMFLTSAFVLLLVGYYVLGSYLTKNLGLTTEASILFVYFLGFMLVTELLPLKILVAMAVVVMLILAFKQKSKELVAGISHGEMKAFISYAIVSVVILPLLPDYSYKLKDLAWLSDFLLSLNVRMGEYGNLEILNPKNIWLVVVLVTGIDIFGHLLAKFFGKKKGFAFASFGAGFVSSTSATLSLAKKSLNSTKPNFFIAAALLANLASFFQIFLLIAPLNGKFVLQALPVILALIFSSGILTFWYIQKSGKGNSVEIEGEKDKKLFSLYPAVKFALLLIVVKIVTKLCLIAFGQAGFLFSSVVASLAGLDATMVNLAEMAGKTLSPSFALLVLVLVNFTNLMSKSIYAFLVGSREFAKNFVFSALVVSFVSYLALVFFV